MQELPVTVEERPGDRHRQEQRREYQAHERLARRHVDEADAPGLHRQRLAAAQPREEVVRGEGEGHERLELVSQHAARGIAPATQRQEHRGCEERDGEGGERLVEEARQAARETRGQCCDGSAGASGERCSGGSDAWYLSHCSRSCRRFSAEARAMRR